MYVCMYVCIIGFIVQLDNTIGFDVFIIYVCMYVFRTSILINSDYFAKTINEFIFII
jgi:hypothetical protein